MHDVMSQTTLNRAPREGDDLHRTLDLSGLPRSAHIPLLAVVYSLGLALFLAVEPTQPWILLAIVALVGLGTDGILRARPGAARL